ncbi:MAG: hypothetical protein CL489_08010 [Acidobacteria bacterium]|nr:hypothetical protein [Acidobacteriota bacterium]
MSSTTHRKGTQWHITDAERKGQMTIPELAEDLGLSRGTVYNYATKGVYETVSRLVHGHRRRMVVDPKKAKEEVTKRFVTGKTAHRKNISKSEFAEAVEDQINKYHFKPEEGASARQKQATASRNAKKAAQETGAIGLEEHPETRLTLAQVTAESFARKESNGTMALWFTSFFLYDLYGSRVQPVELTSETFVRDIQARLADYYAYIHSGRSTQAMDDGSYERFELVLKALELNPELQKVTGRHPMKLGKYKLDNHSWRDNRFFKFLYQVPLHEDISDIRKQLQELIEIAQGRKLSDIRSLNEDIMKKVSKIENRTDLINDIGGNVGSINQRIETWYDKAIPDHGKIEAKLDKLESKLINESGQLLQQLETTLNPIGDAVTKMLLLLYNKFNPKEKENTSQPEHTSILLRINEEVLMTLKGNHIKLLLVLDQYPKRPDSEWTIPVSGEELASRYGQIGRSTIGNLMNDLFRWNLIEKENFFLGVSNSDMTAEEKEIMKKGILSYKLTPEEGDINHIERSREERASREIIPKSALSEERQSIITLLSESPFPQGPTEIAKQLGKTRTSIVNKLREMIKQPNPVIKQVGEFSFTKYTMITPAWPGPPSPPSKELETLPLDEQLNPIEEIEDPKDQLDLKLESIAEPKKESSSYSKDQRRKDFFGVGTVDDPPRNVKEEILSGLHEMFTNPKEEFKEMVKSLQVGDQKTPSGKPRPYYQFTGLHLWKYLEWEKYGTNDYAHSSDYTLKVCNMLTIPTVRSGNLKLVVAVGRTGIMTVFGTKPLLFKKEKWWGVRRFVGTLSGKRDVKRLEEVVVPDIAYLPTDRYTQPSKHTAKSEYAQAVERQNIIEQTQAATPVVETATPVAKKKGGLFKKFFR